MSDAAAGATEPPAPAFNGLQDAHRLPAIDGGGIVFPFGFFGPVYHLPEWEFIRYATYVENLKSQSAAQSWWRRLILRPTRLQSWGMGALALAATILAIRAGALRPQLLLTVMAVGIAWSFWYRMGQIYFAQRQTLVAKFPSAMPLPVHAYWWPHSLATLIMITRADCLRIVWRIATRIGIAVLIFWAYARGILYPLLAAAMIPVFVMQLAQPLAVLASLALVRYHLGRPPVASDLQPVEAPGRDT
jgi:hypothetical protein